MLGLALAGVGVTYVWMPRAAPAVVRFQILAPEGRFDTNIGNPGLNSGTISPDGRKLAFVLTPKLQIWIRPIDSLTATPLAGSDGAAPDLFWSPDSRYVGFFTQDKLKKIDVGGGLPQTLCNVPGGRGGAWNQDGVIVFGQAIGPLLQVSASGGEPSVAIKSPAEGDALWNPTFLPDGRHVLYRVMGSTPGMFVGTLGADGVSRVLNEDHHARYASGHLLYVKEGTLLAHPFSLSTLSTSGDPVPVVERVSYSGILGAYSASTNGVLAYRNAVSSGDDLQLTWVDRAGKSIATVGTAGSYYGVDLAPDGQRIARPSPHGSRRRRLGGRFRARHDVSSYARLVARQRRARLVFRRPPDRVRLQSWRCLGNLRKSVGWLRRGGDAARLASPGSRNS